LRGLLWEQFLPLTDDGFVATRAEEFLTIIRDDYVARLVAAGLSGDIDFERDTFLGNITAVTSVQLGSLSELLQAVYDSRDPNNAAGVQLSSLSLVTGAQRREATFGTVDMTLTGDPGVSVLAGHLVQGGGANGTAQWALAADVVLDGGGSFVGATYRATVAGKAESTAGPGDVDTIVTAVNGLNTVTNPASAIAGLDRESDADLRLRRLLLLQLGGSASAAAIQAEVLALTFILAAVVVENDTDVPITVEGVTAAPRSVAVVVHPATITSAEKLQVADAIYRATCSGIDTNGAEVFLVTGTDLAPKTIRFDLSITLGVTVKYTVERETGVDVPDIAEIKTELVTATEDFFAGLSLSEDVRTLPISCLADPVEGVRSVTVELVPAIPARLQPTGDVSVFNNELAVLAIVAPEVEAVVVIEAP
jgi:hypothetical protein